MPGMKVKDIMTRSFIEVNTGITLPELQKNLESGGWEAAIICDQGRGVKGVAGRDKIIKAREAGKMPDLADAVTVGEDDDVEKVMSLLIQDAGVLVAGGDGRVAGVVTRECLFGKLYGQWQKSQAILETILQFASEAVCVINEKEEVEYWNPRAEVLYCIKAREILGQPVSKFFSNILVSHSLRDRKVFKELYHQPREGAHVLITAAPVPVKDRVIGSLSLERDIADIVYYNEELSRTGFKMRMLKKEINRLSKKDSFARIYGHSTVIKETIKMARKYAATDATVLITGESGTGKELFAQAIHDESNRSQHPFVAVNCSAVPQTLFESEIFGYEGGAFTGAFKEGKPGKFELASGGTLFLDEIGELELGAQVKLLRVLQEKILYRVGGTRPVKVDVRIITATNRNLERMVQEGRFREDLFYRLNVITLNLPPMRERREDMPELAYLLAQELAELHGKKIVEIDPQVMVSFMNYHWPGNVRELRNVLERMVILAEDEVIKRENLPEFLKSKAPAAIMGNPTGNVLKLTEVTEQAERQMIVDALKKTGNNKSEAARILGIPRSSLYYKIKILGIPSNI
ncbi:MAG: sigma 54-interacting transcriptional regulator [Bacillota bacterium]